MMTAAGAAVAEQGTIVVLGDVMLDVEERGSVSRISPEAPVVVLVNSLRSSVLGGAANTAANTLSLGHPTVLVGAIGDDASGDECESLTKSSGLKSALVRCEDIPTTTKTRFLSGGHQIMRWDREETSVSSLSQTSIIDRVLENIDDAVAIVISDYNKGTVSPTVATTVIREARSRGIPIIVDTKKTDISCFDGCTVIAPNHHEARAITGETSAEAGAHAIAEITGNSVLITLGPDGMLILDDGHVSLVPSEVHEVSDVTGAGDTVTAGLAVALAEGVSSIELAARWANKAAGVAVSHAGTYAVPRESVGDLN